MYQPIISTRRSFAYSLILSFIFILGCGRSQSLENRNENILSTSEKEALTAQLNQVYDDDQKYRKLVMAAIEEHGIHSIEVKVLGQRIGRLDSVNLRAVKSIVKQYGWLGSDILGTKANSALFLVIQHADEKTQTAFLPIVSEAVKNNAASSEDLAKLEDRVALNKGEKQIYGTQFGFDEQTDKYYLLPLLDPDRVDERRKKMSLIPISLHLDQWKIDWNPDDYK